LNWERRKLAWLLQGTNPTSAWRDNGKPRRNSSRSCGPSIELRSNKKARILMMMIMIWVLILVDL
jgi:hypothetical protein